jgi:hypothetical protein
METTDFLTTWHKKSIVRRFARHKTKIGEKIRAVQMHIRGTRKTEYDESPKPM